MLLSRCPLLEGWTVNLWRCHALLRYHSTAVAITHAWLAASLLLEQDDLFDCYDGGAAGVWQRRSIIECATVLRLHGTSMGEQSSVLPESESSCAESTWDGTCFGGFVRAARTVKGSVSDTVPAVDGVVM